MKPQSSIIFVEIASAPVNAAHCDHLQLAGGISGYPMRIQVRWTQQGHLQTSRFEFLLHSSVISCESHT